MSVFQLRPNEKISMLEHENEKESFSIRTAFTGRHISTSAEHSYTKLKGSSRALKVATFRHILVHHVFDLIIYLLIFWVMSDDTIVSPNDKQWSVSQCFWCVKRFFEVCSYVKIQA